VYGDTISTNNVPLSVTVSSVSSTVISSFPSASWHELRSAHDMVLSYRITEQFTAVSVQSEGGYAILFVVFSVAKSAGSTGYDHHFANDVPAKSADRRLVHVPEAFNPAFPLKTDWKSIQYVVPRLNSLSKFPSADFPIYSSNTLNVNDSVDALYVIALSCSRVTTCPLSWSCQSTLVMSSSVHSDSDEKKVAFCDATTHTITVK